MNPTPIRDVKLSFKCSANWEGMTADGNGRFCSSCNKKVHDFTNASFADFQKAFIENNGKLCGSFNASQVVTTTSNYSKLKKMLAAALVVLGYNLFGSHAKAQTGVEIEPSDSAKSKEIKTELERRTLGEVASHGVAIKAAQVECVARTINRPENSPSGEILVFIRTGRNGEIKEARILKGLREDIDNEVIRVINSTEFTAFKVYNEQYTLSIPIKPR